MESLSVPLGRGSLGRAESSKKEHLSLSMCLSRFQKSAATTDKSKVMQHISSFFADVCFFFFFHSVPLFSNTILLSAFFFFLLFFLPFKLAAKEGRQKWLRCLVNYSLVCVSEFSKIAQGLFVCLFVCLWLFLRFPDVGRVPFWAFLAKVDHTFKHTHTHTERHSFQSKKKLFFRFCMLITLSCSTNTLVLPRHTYTS